MQCTFFSQFSASEGTAVYLKIADLGISRIMSPGGTMGFKGSPGFMAPEILKYVGMEAVTEKVRDIQLPCLPDLVYFTVCQIWSTSLSARSGLLHCLPDQVYFTVFQIWSISLSARYHCLPDPVYFTVCQIWSISLSARSGLFHCLPDLVYFTVRQIWSISLSARSGLFHCPPDLVYFTVGHCVYHSLMYVHVYTCSWSISLLSPSISG